MPTRSPKEMAGRRVFNPFEVAPPFSGVLPMRGAAGNVPRCAHVCNGSAHSHNGTARDDNGKVRGSAKDASSWQCGALSHGTVREWPVPRSRLARLALLALMALSLA